MGGSARTARRNAIAEHAATVASIVASPGTRLMANRGATVARGKRGAQRRTKATSTRWSPPSRRWSLTSASRPWGERWPPLEANGRCVGLPGAWPHILACWWRGQPVLCRPWPGLPRRWWLWGPAPFDHFILPASGAGDGCDPMSGVARAGSARHAGLGRTRGPVHGAAHFAACKSMTEPGAQCVPCASAGSSTTTMRSP